MPDETADHLRDIPQRPADPPPENQTALKSHSARPPQQSGRNQRVLRNLNCQGPLFLRLTVVSPRPAGQSITPRQHQRLPADIEASAGSFLRRPHQSLNFTFTPSSCNSSPATPPIERCHRVQHIRGYPVACCSRILFRLRQGSSRRPILREAFQVYRRTLKSRHQFR